MHGTLQPGAHLPGSSPRTGSRFQDRVLWLALLPLLILLRPYGGLIQDARIYVGSALADRDRLGVGRDLMFAADGQTGFTLLEPVIRTLLGIMTPTEVSMVLALAGSLLWLGSVVVLCRSLAWGRAAWAAAVCALLLPAGYGAFGNFTYGETILTPRVFAEAAVVGAMASMLGGRRISAGLLLATATALHPLMALPGLAVAAVMLAWEDRRWLLPIGGLALAVLAAAALGLPVAGRLFEPMDAAWLGIVRSRSSYLFPSGWEAEVWVRIAGRVAAVVVAATVAPFRVRVLLLATLAVGAGGLALTALLADWYPLVLVTQLQPWRALWLLALLGNASVALAAAEVWRRGPAGRLTLAVLGLAWLAAPTPPLAIGLAAAAIALRFLDNRGALASLSPRVGRIAIVLFLGAAAVDTALGGYTLAVYLAAARAQGGTPIYAHMLLPGLHVWPLVIVALALALRSASGAPAGGRSRPSGRAKAVSGAILLSACLAGILVWDDGRATERRLIESAGDAAAELRRLIGPAPGSVLWVDDYNETWFLARRAAFFNTTQGGPILFSRRLAFAWHERVSRLVDQGLARHADLTPWISTDVRDGDLPVSRASVEAVCRAPDHPVAIVAPGPQLAAAPPGWAAGLWQPPAPVQYLASTDAGLRWHRIDRYTVIRCPAVDAPPPA